MPSSTLHNPKILPNAGQLLCAAPPAGRPVCSEPLPQTPGSPLLNSDGEPTRGRAEPQRGYELS